VRVTLKVLVGVVASMLLVGGAGATAATLITGKQIKDGTITGKDVKNKSLTAKDFRGSVQGPTGLQGPTGPQGATGPQGPRGLQGAVGTGGIVSVESVHGADVPVTIGQSSVEATVLCPAGETAFGGGGVAGDGDAVLTDSYSISQVSPPRTGWLVIARNLGGNADTVHATAVCAKLG
jgi:hypothetical protein